MIFVCISSLSDRVPTGGRCKYSNFGGKTSSIFVQKNVIFCRSGCYKNNSSVVISLTTNSREITELQNRLSDSVLPRIRIRAELENGAQRSVAANPPGKSRAEKRGTRKSPSLFYIRHRINRAVRNRQYCGTFPDNGPGCWDPGRFAAPYAGRHDRPDRLQESAYCLRPPPLPKRGTRYNGAT